MKSAFTRAISAPVLLYHVTVICLALMSSMTLHGGAAEAHELRPAIADISLSGTEARVEIELVIEAVLAGIDLSAHEDTTTSPEVAAYDALRLEPPDRLETLFRDAWPELARAFTFQAGGTGLSPDLTLVTVPDVGDADLPRDSRIVLTVPLPDDESALVMGWAARLGPLVVRQTSVTGGYTAYLADGAPSDPIPRRGAVSTDNRDGFTGLVDTGFRHVLPRGIDHILFVLGLFFLTRRREALLWQVAGFTAAQMIAFAFAATGTFHLSPVLIGPLLAVSVIYVGMDNLLSRRLTILRGVLVVGFGALHGVAFATAFKAIGAASALSAIAFDLGVVLALLTVVSLAYLSVGHWFGAKSWYRARIATPASVLIALAGAWLLVERTLL